MKPIMLYPVGVVLILCLFSLAGASKQLQIVQWWLNQLDSPQTATAGALAPIIDCVNRVDRDTRLAYYLLTQVDASVRTAERSGAANLPREEFGDNAEPQARLIQKQICTPAITLQLERQAPGSPLITATQQYLQTLRRISDVGTLLSPNQTPGAKTPQQQLFGNVMLDQLKAELSRNGGGYLSASAALRDDLTREELRLRPLQLDLLEARLGRDLHWHLLNYMIASRQSIDRIDQGVRAADLTPQAHPQAQPQRGAHIARQHGGCHLAQDGSRLRIALPRGRERQPRRQHRQHWQGQKACKQDQRNAAKDRERGAAQGGGLGKRKKAHTCPKAWAPCAVLHAIWHLKTASFRPGLRCKSSRHLRASLWFAPCPDQKSIGFQCAIQRATLHQHPGMQMRILSIHSTPPKMRGYVS